MSYVERKELFKKMEELRNRPLIAYVTSIRPNMSVQMASDAINYIIEQIQSIPADQDEVDFLIISNGGDPITAIRIIDLLRERFKKISVLTPYVAYSAATILALGADEIIMHPYSNLGPVDPQLTIAKQSDNGHPSKLNFGAEDIRNYVEFVKKDVGITDQEHLTVAFNALAKEVGPLPIGSAKRGQQLSLSASIKMLETHMEDKNKAATIAQALNTSYYHHGYAVGRSEAEHIGLNIVKPDSDVENLMWAIWKDFSAEMQCDSEFNVVAEIMKNPEAAAFLNTVPVINVPANISSQLAQNLIAQLAQQNAKITTLKPILVEALVASIESTRIETSLRQKFNIAYWREANMSLGFNVTAFSEGWKTIKGNDINE